MNDMRKLIEALHGWRADFGGLACDRCGGDMWVCFDKILSPYSTPTPKDEAEAEGPCKSCSEVGGACCGCPGVAKPTTPKDEGHAVEVEPLAVLADRKGWYIGGSFINRQSRWQIDVCKGYEVDGSCDEYEVFTHRDYAAAEALARAYLETLPDKSKGGE
jgi:hypothetical protein